MALRAGERLGLYEILSPLGAGGRGLPRARDTKLGREVAIKILPEEFTQHPQKLARFERSRLVLPSMLSSCKGTSVITMVVTRGDALERTKELVLRVLADYPVTVYLFGSFARDDARPSSDIDIAVDPHGSLPRGTMARLREDLEESTIPQRVEVVDLRDADPEFRERVRREGVIWSDSGNG